MTLLYQVAGPPVPAGEPVRHLRGSLRRGLRLLELRRAVLRDVGPRLARHHRRRRPAAGPALPGRRRRGQRAAARAALGVGGGVALRATDRTTPASTSSGSGGAGSFGRYGAPIGARLRDLRGRARAGAGPVPVPRGGRASTSTRAARTWTSRERLFVGLYVAPRAFGYAPGRAGVGPEIQAQLGGAWPSGFAWFRLNADGVLGASGLDSGRVEAASTLMSRALPRQTLVRARRGRRWRATWRRAASSTSGSTSTGRGPTARTSSRARAATGWWPRTGSWSLHSLLGLFGVGVAPFVEWGGAWYDDERPRAGGDAGLALRLGSIALDPGRGDRDLAGEPLRAGFRRGRLGADGQGGGGFCAVKGER